VVTWLTRRTAKGRDLGGAVVRYAPAGVDLDSPGAASAVGTTSISGDTALLGSGATTRAVSRATLTGLAPGSVYHYRLENTGGADTYRSADYTFTTEPADRSEPFTFLDFADSQSSPPATGYARFWTATLDAALTRVPNAAFAIHTGDIIDDETRAQLDGWATATGDRLASIPFAPVLGNHEDGASHQAALAQVFPGGTPLGSRGYALNYWFTYGNALFVNLNTNYCSPAQLRAQGKAVERIVAAQARRKGIGGRDKLVIVSLHKSPYGGRHSTPGDSFYRDSMSIRDNLVPALEASGVDLVLSGHDHNYIRTHPMRNDSPTTATAQLGGRDLIDSGRDGIAYLIPRNSGQKSYPQTALAGKWWIKTLQDPRTDWGPNNLSADPSGGVYAKVTVSGETIQVESYTVAGRLIDAFGITQAGLGTGLPAAPAGPPTEAKVAALGLAVGTPSSVKVGAALTVGGVPSDWDVAYQWRRGGAAIAGATASSYPLTAADVGAKLAVEVTVPELGASQTSRAVVVKVTPVLSTKAKGSALAITVKVPAPARATGTVTATLARDGQAVSWSGKATRTATLTARSKAKAALTLPRLPKGTYTVALTYSGNTTTAQAGATITVEAK
jgi:3',5'-cyclic AMP phosphodiesterase CpdA